MEIKIYRQQIHFTKLPGLLRRLVYWFMTNVWTSRASRRKGTFGISVSGFKDVYGTQHLSPLTSTIGIDIISRGGVGRTILTLDHRIVDAIPATRIFTELTRELNGPIREEMQQIANSQVAEPTISEHSPVMSASASE